MATIKAASPFVGVDALEHAEDRCKNIPTAEHQSLMADGAPKPVQVTYARSTSKADHLKAEIDAEAWATSNSDVSRPFEKPKTGRLAVKLVNHLGDAVMKVLGV